MPNYEPSEAVMRGDKQDAVYRDAERAMKSQYEYDHYDRSDEPSDARISAQLDFMTEQLSICQKMFSMLTSQIEAILLPEIDGPENAIGDVPRKMASELSNRLDDLNGQISRLQNRIEKVSRRVQL